MIGSNIPNTTVLDSKAKKILIKTHWSSAGWKREREISSKDFEYAKNAGYMFDPASIDHDLLIENIRSLHNKVSKEQVVNAFLASLSLRRLDIRSALGSFAVSRNLVGHPATSRHLTPQTFKDQNFYCEHCYGLKLNQDVDLSVLNFERHKWGGVRHLRPIYMAFDLMMFEKMEDFVPTLEDIAIFEEIIQVIRSSDATDRPRDLEKNFSKKIKSNKAEREILLEILAYCGLLLPEDQTGFFKTFTQFKDRTMPPVGKIDWNYPIWWWRGEHGINEEALEFWFSNIL